ncbi:carboxypeptidase-like regulatory domain-containing protein [Halobacteria archaeon AArc-m2/3/4]|uniref:Carboxypeptidase-like regulatory domain-containing protein n=1 Tax=Natronoglomus mannanivorans TaxID=2979990 RepID=A0AAP2Z0Q9_9EURY|nr:carboxypeptidase-like regulatory domain-containing protein [Halobacteria archaeon AArc-xg1-1]MCU4972280.1 carboxypeptidase-like regulatory domain-containing protein [Halobacteria archaeon AArc-m2/3/4]
MEEVEITRRRFTLGTTAALSASLAGCLGDDDEEENGNGDDGNGNGDDGNGDDEATETEEETDNDEGDNEEEEEEPQYGTLAVNVEDEDGEPVSEGITFRATPDDDGHTLLMQSFADGQGAMQNVEPGSYTATVEGDGFETAEDELTIEAGEETELTLALEEAAEDDE